MMISSAVIVPEPDDLSPASPPQKRRQSSESYHETFKRPRLESQVSRDSNGYAIPPSATSPPRRKPSITGSGAVEERKRGQRLFGALLGTLSQSSTTTAQRRRADIEKKQLGKLQQRDEALEEEKRRKREKLDVIRRKEQGVWDGQSMRIRHRDILAEAHFLRTKAEPRLFYKPWEIRPEEEEQIKHQIEDAKKSIEAEADEHQAKKRDEEKDKAEEVQHPHPSASQLNGAEPSKQPENAEDIVQENGQPKTDLVGADTTNDEQATTYKSVPELDTANNEDKPKAQAKVGEVETGKQEEKTNEDHGGEELVEGQEDDVIY